MQVSFKGSHDLSQKNLSRETRHFVSTAVKANVRDSVVTSKEIIVPDTYDVAVDAFISKAALKEYPAQKPMFEKLVKSFEEVQQRFLESL